MALAVRPRQAGWRAVRGGDVPRWVLPVGALVAGVGTAFAFAPTGWWPLAMLGPGLGLGVLARAGSARRGAVLGLAYGLGFAFVLLRWTIDLHVGMFLALPTVLTLWFVLLGAVVGRLAVILRPAWWVVGVGASWTLMEAARARGPLSGLEWGQLGVATADSPVRQAAAVLGTLGLSGLLVAVAASLAVLGVSGLGRWRPLAASLAALIGVLVAGLVPWTSEQGALGVAVVQVDDPCPDAFAVDCPDLRERLLAAFLDGTAQIGDGVDLILWGEGALGGDPDDAGDAIAALAGPLQSPLLAGTATSAGAGTWWNRNVLYGVDGAVLDAYAKRNPVPFGEYVPWRDVLGGIADVGRLVPTDLLAGDDADPILVPLSGTEARVGSVVSWEVTFSRLVRDVAEDAELLATLTTQASYGNSPVSDQLLAAAQMRAAELQKPLVVAATTGRSTVIDATGDRLATTALYDADVLTAQLQLREGLTPYARFGELPVVMLAVVALITALVVGRRSRTAARSEEPAAVLAGSASGT